MSARRSLKELRFKYRSKAKGGPPGSLFLLEPEDALSYIDDGVEEGYEVWGVEGFFITSAGGYQPSQEHSNDIYYSELSPKEFAEETKEFIRERADIPRIHFDVVFDEVP